MWPHLYTSCKTIKNKWRILPQYYTHLLFLPGLFHTAGMLSPSDKKFQYSKKGVGWTSNFNNNPRNWISIGNKRQKCPMLLMMPLLKEIKWWYMLCNTSTLYWIRVLFWGCNVIKLQYTCSGVTSADNQDYCSTIWISRIGLSYGALLFCNLNKRGHIANPSNNVLHTVKQENLAHTYFCANATANTLEQFNFSTRIFYFKKVK